MKRFTVLSLALGAASAITAAFVPSSKAEAKDAKNVDLFSGSCVQVLGPANTFNTDCTFAPGAVSCLTSDAVVTGTSDVDTSNTNADPAICTHFGAGV